MRKSVTIEMRVITYAPGLPMHIVVHLPRSVSPQNY
jgi:hypothetical protein